MKKKKKCLSLFGCVYLIALLIISVTIIYMQKYHAGGCNINDIVEDYRATAVTSVNGKENNRYYVLTDNGYRYDLDIVYQDYVWEKCVEYGIQDYYELMLAVMYHESKFNSSLKSSTNDYGLMQINACNHGWLRKELDIDDFLNPYDSIDAGVYMMNLYLTKYNDTHMALMCYNMGEGGANYAKKIGRTSSAYSRGVVSDIEKLRVLEE